MDNENKIYCDSKLRNTMESLMFDLLTMRPRDIVVYSIEWLRNKGNYTASGLKSEEKQELEDLRKSIQAYRHKEESNATTRDDTISEESVKNSIYLG